MNKTTITYLLVAAGAWWLLSRYGALPAGLPEWAYLQGMRPGSDQARMLAEQERDFWKAATVSGSTAQPLGWYEAATWNA